MKKSAAYLINGTIIMQAMSLTDTGLWIAHGEALSVPADDHTALLRAIKKTLENSVEDIAHPPQSEWKNIQRATLDAAGVKTWAALGKKAKAVGIECEYQKIAFIPAINFRNYGGEGSDEHTISCEINDELLGAKLIEAFKYAS